jgi:hypothetical protein
MALVIGKAFSQLVSVQNAIESTLHSFKLPASSCHKMIVQRRKTVGNLLHIFESKAANVVILRRRLSFILLFLVRLRSWMPDKSPERKLANFSCPSWRPWGGYAPFACATQPLMARQWLERVTSDLHVWPQLERRPRIFKSVKFACTNGAPSLRSSLASHAIRNLGASTLAKPCVCIVVTPSDHTTRRATGL